MLLFPLTTIFIEQALKIIVAKSVQFTLLLQVIRLLYLTPAYPERFKDFMFEARK